MNRIPPAFFLFVLLGLFSSYAAAQQCGGAPSLSATAGPELGQVTLVYTGVEGSNGTYVLNGRPIEGQYGDSFGGASGLLPGQTVTQTTAYYGSSAQMSVNMTYVFRVSTMVCGVGVQSGEQSVTIPDIGYPSLSLSVENGNQVHLSWPSVNGASTYCVEVLRIDQGGTWDLPLGCFPYTPNTAQYNYTYTPAFTSSAYCFAVRARRDGSDHRSGTECISWSPDQGWGRDCKGVGKPVNVTNGNMYIDHTDHLLPGPAGGIGIARTYNSMDQSAGLFGWGWTSPLDERVAVMNNFVLRLAMDDGRAVYLARQDLVSPYRSATPSFFGQIVRNADNSYTLTMPDGTVHQYDAAGKILWHRDRNNNQTTFNYASGVLTGIIDPFGRALIVNINANGYVGSISDTLGTIATYAYDPAFPSRLLTVTYQGGFKYQFEYDSTTVPGKVFIKTVKDADGRILETHLYDSQGRAFTSEVAGGNEKYTLDFAHANDAANPYTKVTDALLRETKHYIDRSHGRNAIVRVEGNCACGSGTELTSYEYDAKLNLKKLTQKVSDTLDRVTTFEYDASGNMTKQTDPWGTETFTYNAFNELLAYRDRVDSQASNPPVNTVANTYNATGDLLTATRRNVLADGSIRNETTTLTYPATGNRGLPDSVRDARDNTTNLKWFATSGLLQEIEDPYGKKTNFTYDARGRAATQKHTVTVPGNPTPVDLITTYTYVDNYTEADDDNVTRTHSRVEVTYPNGDAVKHRFDTRGLLDRATDERGKITRYAYDDARRLTQVTDPLGHARQFGYDPMSNRTSYTDPLGKVTNYERDAFDRLAKITYPAKEAGATRLFETFEYDKIGRPTKHFDTANRPTQYAYDDATRTNTVTNPEMEATTVKYNQRFQTTEVRDALNQTYTFTYDPLGRLLSQTRAGASISYEYDPNGNRTKRTDYAGRVTNYTFDKLNRLTRTEYDNNNPAESPANPVDKLASNYAYDEISRLTSATNEAGTVSFKYDGRNRLINTTDVFGHAIDYEYERTTTLNQKRLKFDGSLHAKYDFDDAGRLLALTNSADNSAISFGYDNEDKPISRTYPNGVTTTYDYFDDDQLKRLKDASSAATLFDRQYTYNTAKQIDTITELSGTRTFTYDLVDRLKTVTASNNQNESYTYDLVGNRTASHRSTTYGYQTGQFNQLITTAGATYTFNGNGNTATKSEDSQFWRYSWDGENRLVQASNRKDFVRYRYDALGRRVQRTLGYGKESTRFVYDGADVLADDNAGTLTKYQNGLGVDEKLRVQTGTDVKYFLADHLGSTNGLADSTGAVTGSNSYDAFGNPTNAAFPTRYQYTGREYDAFSGFYYYRARVYDPNLGRFASEDPIGFRGRDINLYGYVKNQPLFFRDPRGLMPGEEVLRDPNILQGLAAAASTVGAYVAAAAPPVAVAGAGLGIGYAIGYYPGQLSARYFYPDQFPETRIHPIPFPNHSDTVGKFSKPEPYCQSTPQPIPFYRTPTTTWPDSEPNRDGCAEEWSRAYEICASAMLGGIRGITGGHTDEYSCAKGLVSQRCGGNRVE
jgi:RHS repeat-associated protein